MALRFYLKKKAASNIFLSIAAIGSKLLEIIALVITVSSHLGDLG
jgi:hypothetical protein